LEKERRLWVDEKDREIEKLKMNMQDRNAQQSEESKRRIENSVYIFAKIDSFRFYLH